VDLGLGASELRVASAALVVVLGQSRVVAAAWEQLQEPAEALGWEVVWVAWVASAVWAACHQAPVLEAVARARGLEVCRLAGLEEEALVASRHPFQRAGLEEQEEALFQLQSHSPSQSFADRMTQRHCIAHFSMLTSPLTWWSPQPIVASKAVERPVQIIPSVRPGRSAPLWVTAVMAATW